MIGSQWWCLRRRTIEAILRMTRERRDVMRFFRTTWIPDETFFQTLVRHLVPDAEIRTRTLTFLMFTDYGMPVTFYNDHYDLLLGQDYLFARKISPEAQRAQAAARPALGLGARRLPRLGRGAAPVPVPDRARPGRAAASPPASGRPRPASGASASC